MNKINNINRRIIELKKIGFNLKEISDGNHTFEELYNQRTILFSIICSSYPDLSWKSKKHFDEENDPMFNGSFIAGINTPNGIVTYHIKLKYWDEFNIKELERAPKFDGYSSEDCLTRIKSLKKTTNHI